MDRRLLPIIVLVPLVFGVRGLAAQPAPSRVVDRPRPEECRVEPRTEEELRALLPMGEADVEALERQMNPTDLPAGERAGPEVIAGIAAAVREFYACSNAQDEPRLLALLPDRVVAVIVDNAFGGGFLYAFARVGERWRIDDWALVPFGVSGTTFTEVASAGEDDGAAYSYGVEWTDPWQAVEGAPTLLFDAPGDIELRTGASTLAFGDVAMAEIGDRSACEEDETDRLAEVLTRLHVDPLAEAPGEGPAVTVATATGGQTLRRREEGRAWVAYDVALYPGGDRVPGAGGEAIPYRLWVECRVLGGGFALLEVVHLAPLATWVAEATARDAVLATVEVSPP
jgi:hypothetical protein